jgi:DtxR family transcriptional regulator, Mn-dependent transcriptional regulator
MATSSTRGLHGKAVENYAKAIYALQQRDGGAVGTGDLADRLGVTAGSASATVKRMADRGLATHAPYKGVTLTAAGETVALEVLRHHHLLELYLVEFLGVPSQQARQEAEALEHVISEDLEARIAAKLGHLTLVPRGDPIPSVELRVDDGSRVQRSRHT